MSANSFALILSFYSFRAPLSMSFAPLREGAEPPAKCTATQLLGQLVIGVFPALSGLSLLPPRRELRFPMPLFFTSLFVPLVNLLEST
jgi:hypothetical protein